MWGRYSTLPAEGTRPPDWDDLHTEVDSDDLVLGSGESYLESLTQEESDALPAHVFWALCNDWPVLMGLVGGEYQGEFADEEQWATYVAQYVAHVASGGQGYDPVSGCFWDLE